MKQAARDVEKSLEGISLSIDDLADIQLASVLGDREEQLGVLCFEPDKKTHEIKRVKSFNDAFISSPELDIKSLATMCPKKHKTTLWHTHGTNLNSFSDFDRYSASDVAAIAGNIGLCSLGMNAIQCHYAFFSPPIVANIDWKGKLIEKVKENTKQSFIGNTLSCDNSLQCRMRDWTKKMEEMDAGNYNQVNILDGISVSINDDGSFISSSNSKMSCHKTVSEDGFVTLHCVDYSKNEGD